MSKSVPVYEFVGIGEMAETTIQLLSLTLRHSTPEKGRSQSRGPGLDQVTQLVLQQARDYLARVREGFVLSVRTAQVTDRQEIQYLLDRVLIDWAQLSQELGIADDPAPTVLPRDVGELDGSGAAGDRANEGLPGADEQLEHVRTQLMAYGMATVALGHLPRLPAEQITFPHSYSEPPT